MALKEGIFAPDRRNYIEFIDFLSLALKNKQKHEDFFTLKYFMVWKEKYEHVDLKITTEGIRVYILYCKIPETELWIPLIDSYDKEGLVEKILKNGLSSISDIFREYCILNRIQHNEKISINEFEITRDTNFFKYEPHNLRYYSCFSVWKYEKTSCIVVSRIGKDNRIESESLIRYYVVCNCFIIKDDYLESLLPKECLFSEMDYGYVSSQTNLVSEKVIKDSQETAIFLEKYNVISHYQYLLKIGRGIKYDDSNYYVDEIN